MSSFVVRPRKWAEIEQIAERFRMQLGLKERPYFPVIDVVERLLCDRLEIMELRVASVSEMGNAEGYTCPQGEFIQLREDVYEAACHGDPRARFTVAHELGHLILHSGEPLKRVDSTSGIKVFRLSEPQADHFAGCLLMPQEFFSSVDTRASVMRRHGVSNSAAKVRMDKISKNLGGHSI